MQMIHNTSYDTHFTAKPSESTRRGSQRQAIYRHIVRKLCTEGLTPNISDIQNALHIRSSANVYYHLEQLEARGWLKRVPKKWRNLVVPVFSTTASQIPEATLRLISTPFQSTPGRLTLRICTQIYQSEHLCVGDVITAIPDSSIDGQLLVVLRCPLHERPSLTLIRIQKQDASGIIHLRLVECENGQQESLLLPPEEWQQDWVVLGAVTSILRSVASSS
jgi:hypothetical protein